MSDLKTLSFDRFEPCLNQAFTVSGDDNARFDMTLIVVEKRGQFDPDFADRQAFSLIFRGPLEPVLEQQIRTLQHETLGAHDIFRTRLIPNRYFDSQRDGVSVVQFWPGQLSPGVNRAQKISPPRFALAVDIT